MKKIVLAFSIALMTVSTVFAQQRNMGTEHQNLRGPFVTNSFGDNWFISIGAGIDGWFRPSKAAGEEFGGFGSVAPVFQLGIGKMLHPNYGLRIRGSYGTVKDYTSFAGPYTESLKEAGKYNLKFNYWTLGADFLFHFSNAVGGYKEARFYNLILVAGGGFARSNGKDLGGVKTFNDELAANFALLNSFRLSRCVDLNLELGTMVVRQGFSNEGSTAARAGMLPSATLGFTFKFKDYKFYTAQSLVDDAVANATRGYNTRISDLERDLASAETMANRARAEADAAREAARRAAAEAEAAKAAAAKVPQAVPGNDFDRVPVAFFPIGRSRLSDAGIDVNIGYIADAIKANPGRVYNIIGLADAATGGREINQTLSEQRAENVRAALVAAGVDPSQLKVKALGDTVNPFASSDMNRVVIVELE